MARGSRGTSLARIRDIAMPTIACLIALGLIAVGRGWHDWREGLGGPFLMFRGDATGLVVARS